MLISFRVSNYKTFNDSATLNMLKGKVIKHPNHVSDIGPGVLKHAVVYGSNASGKSCFISALKLMQTLINESRVPIPFRAPIFDCYCKCDKDNKDRPSEFEINFSLEDSIFNYGFDIVLSSHTITQEWLYILDSELNPVDCVFDYELIDGEPITTFSNTLDEHTINEFRRVIAERLKDSENRRYLLIDFFNQLNPIFNNLKRIHKKSNYEMNVDANQLKNYLTPILAVEYYFNSKLLIDPSIYWMESVPSLMKDFKGRIEAVGDVLNSIGIENTTVSEINTEVPEHIVNLLNSKFLLAEEISQEGINELGKYFSYFAVKTDKSMFRSSSKPPSLSSYLLSRESMDNVDLQSIDQLFAYLNQWNVCFDTDSIQFKNGKLISLKIKQIIFRHYGIEGGIDVLDESLGTRAALKIAPLLLCEDGSDYTFIFDEFGSSIHPMVLDNIVKKFQKINALNNNQLICATHYTTLMTQNLFRRDEFWFVDKFQGKSELYSLEEFDIRSDKSVSKDYMEGRFGALPVFEE